MRVRLLLTALLVAGVVALVPSAPSMASSASLRSTAPYGKAMRNEAFTLKGRFSTGFARTARLQYRRGSHWVTLKSKRSTSHGAFTFSGVRLTATRTYQVAAPAVRHHGKRYRATRTPRRTVRLVGQTSSIELLPGIKQRSTSPAPADQAGKVGVARFAPARPGRSVAVQSRLADGTWKTVGTAREDRYGVAQFTWTAESAHRAIAASYRGAASKRTTSTTSPWTKLAFDDEFTTTASSMWQTRGTGYSKSSKRACSKASPDMVSLSSGALVLKAAVDDSQAGPCTWTDPTTGEVSQPGPAAYYLNGHVGTNNQFSFRYGVAAARVKFERPQGLHGAFWMQSVDSSSIYSEIDAAEFFGQGFQGDPNGKIGNFIHYQPEGGTRVRYGAAWRDASAWLGTKDDWWTGYHVFSVEWTPSGYVFRVDGHETRRVTGGISNNSEFLVLSLLSSDYEVAAHPFTSPQTMSVDWVRVWQDPQVSGSLLNRQPIPTS